MAKLIFALKYFSNKRWSTVIKTLLKTINYTCLLAVNKIRNRLLTWKISVYSRKPNYITMSVGWQVGTTQEGGRPGGRGRGLPGVHKRQCKFASNVFLVLQIFAPMWKNEGNFQYLGKFSKPGNKIELSVKSF